MENSMTNRTTKKFLSFQKSGQNNRFWGNFKRKFLSESFALKALSIQSLHIFSIFVHNILPAPSVVFCECSRWSISYRYHFYLQLQPNIWVMTICITNLKSSFWCEKCLKIGQNDHFFSKVKKKIIFSICRLVFHVPERLW